MAKEVTGYLKLQVKGGQANPAPPIGPALGSKGLNIMDFCKQFNARTQDKQGQVLPVLLTIYNDKSFDFVIKTAPAPVQLMEAAKIQKGSKESNREKVGKVTWAQVEAIAKDKMEDLNAFTIESAMSMVAGTARSMQEKLQETKRLQKTLESIVLEKTKIPKKKLKEIFQTKKDWYMSAEEAKKLGVVDTILK